MSRPENGVVDTPVFTRQSKDDVRITISHNRSKQDVMQGVDRSFHELFEGAGALPVRLVVDQKNWQGATLTFALTAKMGLMSTPIHGTIEVTEKDLTIDANLGILEHFVPAGTARDLITNRIKGLLK